MKIKAATFFAPWRKPIYAALLTSMLLFLASAGALAQADASNPGGTQHLYLPYISNAIDDTTTDSGSVLDPCATNPQEDQIADLLRNDSRQARATLQCDPLLAAVARAKASDMAQRNYFDHVNPDGVGPNLLVQQAGRLLPASYSQDPWGNNIESIAAGFDTAEGAWEGWLNSEHHRPHVLGEDPFFVQQTEYGVGYYYDPNSVYHHYWVVLTAHAD